MSLRKMSRKRPLRDLVWESLAAELCQKAATNAGISTQDLQALLVTSLALLLLTHVLQLRTFSSCNSNATEPDRLVLCRLVLWPHRARNRSS